MMFIEDSPIENNLKQLILTTNGISSDLKATGKFLNVNGLKDVDIDLDEVRQEEREDSCFKVKTEKNQPYNLENVLKPHSRVSELKTKKAAGEKDPNDVGTPAAGQVTILTKANGVAETEKQKISPQKTQNLNNIIIIEEEESEEFTLIDVFDEEDTCSKDDSKYLGLRIPTEDEGNRSNEIVIQTDQEIKDNINSVLENTKSKNLVRKRLHVGNISNNTYNLSRATNRELPPVPDAVPIEEFFRSKHNNKNYLLNQSLHYSKEQTSSSSNLEYQRFLVDNIPTEKEAEKALENNELLRSFLKDSQMGFEFISKIRKYFNIGINSTEVFDREEGSRKRRLEDCVPGSARPNLIKYRRVDNHFPKYITHKLEDDMNPQAGRSVFQPSFNLYSNSLDSEQNRRSVLLQDIDKQRRSLFSMPNKTHNLLRNTSYADVEFSDDEEDGIKDISLNAEKSLNKNNFGSFIKTTNSPCIMNIPINRPKERSQFIPSIKTSKVNSNQVREQSNGKDILATSLGTELNTLNKPCYADVLREGRISKLKPHEGYVLGERPLNSFISEPTSTKMIAFDHCNKINSIWSTNARSIIHQEKEREEREKYKQLLQKVAPCIYDRNKKISSSINKLTRNRRSLLVDRSDISINQISLYGNTQSSKLFDTINIEDDVADDVSITGVIRLPLNQRSTKDIKLPVTVIDVDNSDDEVSEIIEIDDIISASSVASLKENITIFDKQEKKKKTSKLPYVAPINSLEDCFNSSPHLKDNWLEKFQIKWNQNKKLRQRQLEETTIVADKITAERRAAEIRIQERLREFHIVEPDLIVVDDFPESEEEPEITLLTEQQQDRIKTSIYGPPDQVLVSKFNMNISRRDIQTLLGNNWLNDEVINFYMNLLMERGEKKNETHGYPTVYAMNTFFVPRLMQGGHSGVKRWTRKVDIFVKDVIPVPVHVGGVHWCMAIIHLKNRTIKYYDSMGTPNPSVLKALEKYLQEESLDKRKVPFDTSKFQIESVKDVPRQMNGSDCGVFSCMFAEYITRNKEITFSQAEMEFFRHKMILEIVQGELLR